MSGFHIDEPFDLPVDYQGKEMLLPGTLVRCGYSYKIHIEVDGRAILDEQNKNSVSLEIVSAIGEALEKHLR